MSSVTPVNPKFKENLAGFFHDLLRAAGITMAPTRSTERIREIGSRMAESIEHAAERKSIEVIKKLQEAVLSAFNKVEDRLNNQGALLAAQQELLVELKERIESLEQSRNRQEWKA